MLALLQRQRRCFPSGFVSSRPKVNIHTTSRLCYAFVKVSHGTSKSVKLHACLHKMHVRCEIFVALR